MGTHVRTYLKVNFSSSLQRTLCHRSGGIPLSVTPFHTLMGDSIPKWARAARPGSYVEAKHADGTLQKVLFEGKRGVVFGRNGQV